MENPNNHTHKPEREDESLPDNGLGKTIRWVLLNAAIERLERTQKSAE